MMKRWNRQCRSLGFTESKVQYSDLLYSFQPLLKIPALGNVIKPHQHTQLLDVTSDVNFCGLCTAGAAAPASRQGLMSGEAAASAAAAHEPGTLPASASALAAASARLRSTSSSSSAFCGVSKVLQFLAKRALLKVMQEGSNHRLAAVGIPDYSRTD